MLVTVKFLDRRSPGGTSGALRRVIVAVGGELDQGVESGEQPAVMGWHGKVPSGRGERGAPSPSRRRWGKKMVRPICGWTVRGRTKVMVCQVTVGRQVVS